MKESGPILEKIVITGAGIALVLNTACATMNNYSGETQRRIDTTSQTDGTFTKTRQIPSTSYSVGAKGKNVSLLLTTINRMVDAYRDAGLTEADLTAVDNGDKVIYSSEFIRALKNKYGDNVKGFTYENFEFQLVR